MAKLKMVAGKTYVFPPLGVDRIISRGEVIEVTDEQADILLADTYFDALNNEHAYFKDVSDEADASAASDEEAAAETQAKPATRTRAKK